MGFAHEYATAVAQRGRVLMEPVDFVPDWADKPRRVKYYPDAESIPLPDGDYPTWASVGRALGLDAGLPGDGKNDVADGAPFTLPLLGGMLRDSYGLVGRRIGVQANTDLGALPSYRQANWSRGNASGGGLYPVSVYWATGPSGPLLPGTYYYSADHHAMQRLASGDPTGDVRAALGDGATGADADQFLLLGVKFWQNSFKYNSFTFHAVTMDIGTLIQTWRMWGRPRGLRIAPLLWFDERRLSTVAGVVPEEEGLFAVVPLRWDAPGPPPGAGQRGDRQNGGARLDGPRAPAPFVRHRDRERSRTVLTFETVQRIHAATSEHAADRPPIDALETAQAAAPRQDNALIPLPEPTALTADVRTALRTRRSSFGRFSAERAVDAAQLAALLAAADAGARFACDVGAPGGAVLARLFVFVNHVAGIAPGTYEFDRVAGGLRLVKAGAAGAFLQRNYFLANYNLEQAAAVIVPAVRTHAVLDAVGDRGYRLVNAAIGACAQATYTASASLGVACGVALGFDAISYIEELDLADSGEIPLLIMLVGHERPRPADFHAEIALGAAAGGERL